MAKDQRDLGRQGGMGVDKGKQGEVGKQGGDIGKQGGMPEKKDWEKDKDKGVTHEPGRTGTETPPR